MPNSLKGMLILCFITVYISQRKYLGGKNRFIEINNRKLHLFNLI